ncbi:lipopolysaccharide biosynthesis protein [Kosakonia quasisacchari]|uniref:lipopolysaccharide biosynthesis protein n=1 Tax=Kosakonia quasisacchari TaxID=2529380 RepID=UPI0039E1A6C1
MFKKIVILYAAQLYRVAFPLFLVPLIIGLLGTERYGIVSFFTMLITLMGLLDAGISGTFIKLVATNKNNLVTFIKVIKLFIKVLCGFVIVAGFVSFAFNYFSLYIVTDWLQTTLSREETVYCIKLTGIILALLYLRSYLQSFINGMERQDLIAIWNMFYTTAFYGGSYLILSFYSNTLFAFFNTLLFLSIIDIIATLSCVAYVVIKQHRQLIGCDEEKDKNSTDIISFINIVKFSLQLSGLSMIWVIATQVDKIALSTYTDLTLYTHYQIGSQLSAVVLALTAPLSQFLLPRLSALVKENNYNKFIELFSISSVGYVVILGPLVPYMCVYGNDLISLWLKNKDLGFAVNLYAKWLVSAAFFAGIMNFVFILLYSKGQLKYHFYAYASYSAITIPLTIIIAKLYGPEWLCIFYFIHTILFMILWGGFCLGKEMIGYISLLFPLASVVLILSFLVFFIIQKLQIFISYRIIYVIFPPVVNVIIISTFLYFLRMPLMAAVRSIKLKKWY